MCTTYYSVYYLLQCVLRTTVCNVFCCTIGKTAQSIKHFGNTSVEEFKLSKQYMFMYMIMG